MLVYRLVCQPVTLESWVRFPDVALQYPKSGVFLGCAHKNFGKELNNDKWKPKFRQELKKIDPGIGCERIL